MRKILFDTGTLITIVTTNSLEAFEKLKDHIDGEFYITPEIKKELIDRPIKSKKFRLEAFKMMELVNRGFIKIVDVTKKDLELTKKIEKTANEIFKTDSRNINIVHSGEIELIAVAINNKAHTVAMDERTTKQLIENPIHIARRLERKLHRRIHIDHEKISELHKMLMDIKVIRSIDILMRAFELGLYNDLIFKSEKKIFSNLRKEFAEGIAWACRFKGCALTDGEIKEYSKQIKTKNIGLRAKKPPKRVNIPKK